jgi:drug/metabolite transporter (DMT)-like permease
VSQNRRLLGTALTFMACVGFSIVPALAKSSYDAGANALGVMTVRFSIATVLLFVARFVFGRKESWPDRRRIVELLVIGAVGITAVSLTYFIAIDDIDTSLAIVLWYVYPVFVVAVSWVLFKKRPRKNVFIALPFTLAGIAVTAGQVSGGSGTAITLVMVSSFLFSFYILALDRASRGVGLITNVTVLSLGTAIGYWIVCLTPITPLEARFPDDTRTWVLITTLAVFGTTAPFLFSVAGLTRLEASTYSVITTIEPVIGIIVAVLFLGESMSPERLIGAALVIGALVGFSVSESRAPATPAHQ